jgi:putative FmdB family regulatory protein
MPIYEYRCAACRHELDALEKINGDPLLDCPECGAPALKRLISAPSFRLKGSGWYETDFKSDKERKRNLADGAGDKAATESNSTDAKSSAESKGKDAPATKGSQKAGDTKPAAGSGDAKAVKSSGGSGSEAA